jgi:hypothetical protein
VDNGEKMRFSLRTHTADVRCRDQTYGLSAQWTYAPEPGRTVTVWQGSPIFAKSPIAYDLLDLGLL